MRAAAALLLVLGHLPAPSAGWRTLVVEGLEKIAANRTLSRDTVVSFASGGAFHLADGVTLEIEGSLTAPPVQVFFGPGRVLFTSGLTEQVTPQWWGAVGDGVQDDGEALQACLRAYPPQPDGVSGRIWMPRGDYLTSRTLFLGGGGELYGDGATIRARDQTGDKLDAIITIPPGNVTRQSTTLSWRIRGIKLVGAGANPTAEQYTKVGLNCASVSYAMIEDIGISNCQTALKLDGATDIFEPCMYNTFRHVMIGECQTGVHVNYTIVASFYNFIMGNVEVGFAVMGSNSVNIFAPSIEGFGTAVVVGGTGLGAGWVAPCKPPGSECSDPPQREEGWPATATCGWPTSADRWPCKVENQTWNGDTLWLYNAFLGVGGVGVRLRAGSEHGIVSPRLTQVNATIVEERDPYTQNGHGTANQSHDYIVYPGYPDKESGTYEPVCEMSFCGVAPRPDGQR